MYEFAVYAYLAGSIAAHFFPAADDSSSLLSTFAVFGVGFLARPLGGVVIGRLGDTRGCKAALVVTVMLMALGTVAIGLTPDYDAIGMAAPLSRASRPEANGAARPSSSSSGHRRGGAAAIHTLLPAQAVAD